MVRRLRFENAALLDVCGGFGSRFNESGVLGFGLNEPGPAKINLHC